MRGHLFHEVDIAFVGCVNVERRRAQPRVAGFFENHRFCDMAQAESPHIKRSVGCEQTRSAGAPNQFVAQRFIGAVAGLARIVFERDDLLGNKAPRAITQLADVRCEGEIHGGSLRCCL